HLDFDAHYEGNEDDELGVLGKSINDMSNQLERTISELQKANLQLKKDIEEKIKIDEMRKEFLSNVSHELKTPLALIQGYAEGLKECINDDAERREFYCDVIVDEAGEGNELVNEQRKRKEVAYGSSQLEMERFVQ